MAAGIADQRGGEPSFVRRDLFPQMPKDTNSVRTVELIASPADWSAIGPAPSVLFGPVGHTLNVVISR